MRLWIALMLIAMIGWGSGCARHKPPPPPPPWAGPGFGPSAASPTEPPRVVFFRGPVRKFVVPWTSDLTLSKAILEAEYTGLWDPYRITVTRKGQVVEIKPKRLLQGLDDLPLEPGDIVELHR